MCSAVQKKEIVDYLINLGCCLNCSIRYLCDKQLEFSDLDEFLTKNSIAFKDSNLIENEANCKKQKTNPCIICLGLLQETFLKEILSSSDLDNHKKYDSPTFSVSISMPVCILLRERSMRIHLEEKFPTFFNDENKEIPINRVWKMFVKNPLIKHLNKKFLNSDEGEFYINITTNYGDDIEELKVLQEIHPEAFKIRAVQHRKYHGELYTRKGVLDILAKTSQKLFSLNFPVPPQIPHKFLTCKAIEFKKLSCFLAGRYCKYSRELSQSPWVIDDKRIMETSVQEIIFEQICQSFNIPNENLKFSSSGREDCDVRCLGKGRPFYIEIIDPKKSEFSFEEFRNLERNINKSALIQVRDLQKVSKSDLKQIKDGEDTKTKTYSALCVIKEDVTEELLAKINGIQVPIELKQKTPIRVLHRRSLTVRLRNIEQIKAMPTKYPKAFELQVVTQAGTYVKEFVHGDFGRTNPSLATFIGCEVDIAALDVVAINLDWPKEILDE